MNLCTTLLFICSTSIIPSHDIFETLSYPLTSELSKLQMLLWKPFIVPELFWSSLHGLVLLWVYELVCYLWFIPLIARHVIHQFASCSSRLKTLQDCCTVVCWCVLALLFLVILIPPKLTAYCRSSFAPAKLLVTGIRTLGPSDTEHKLSLGYSDSIGVC